MASAKEKAAVAAIKELITEQDEAKILESLGTALGAARDESPRMVLEVVLEKVRQAYREKADEVITAALPDILKPDSPEDPGEPGEPGEPE